MNKKIYIIGGTTVALSMLAALPALAATHAGINLRLDHKGPIGIGIHRPIAGHPMSPMVFGTVASINGTTISLTGKNNTTYSVDATNAKVMKGFGTVAQVSDIKVGDSLMVNGTINGTSVTATMIMDGQPPKPGVRGPKGPLGANRFMGNGSMGSVTAVSGNSFTIQNKGRGGKTTSVTVTTDANTKVTKNGQADTLGDVAVGQMVMVKGTKNATTSTIAATDVNIIVRVPVVRVNGTVQSVSGNTLTVLGSDGVTYTVDATKAHVGFGRKQGSLATIQVNDKVMISGAAGASAGQVTARVIIDSTSK